jgi:hypothetical protein
LAADPWLDFIGGNLGLDFANTINARTEPERDDLRSFDDMLAWPSVPPFPCPEPPRSKCGLALSATVNYQM